MHICTHACTHLACRYRAVASALEVIPRTLAQNCGGDTVRLITALRAKHASGENKTWGINGNTGELADMKELGVWEPFAVKVQTIKTSIEVCDLAAGWVLAGCCWLLFGREGPSGFLGNHQDFLGSHSHYYYKKKGR